jgi:lipopolysaccharide transport system permease protein
VLLKPLLGLIRHHELIREMAIRDAKGVNKGSALGNGWLVLRPLIQTVAYVIIVSFVFQSRLSPDAKIFDYAMFVLCGMVPWQMLVQALVTAPSLVRSHADLVKQVVYPIETLPLRNLVVGSFSSLVSLSVYFVLATFTGGLHWSILLLPIPFVLLSLFVVGLSWILMVLGAFFQDFREIIGASMNLLIFMSPVVIAESMVSDRVWFFIQMNPLSHIVICFRDTFNGELHWMSWLAFCAMTAVLLAIGSGLLNRYRLRINDYI